MSNTTPQAFTYYAVKRPGSQLIELRQTRFKKQFESGVDHPHDVCAIAATAFQLKEMVRDALPGATVDYSQVER